MLDQLTGTVKWFNNQKGYGFLEPNDGGKDVLIDISIIESAELKTLKEGQTVHYDLYRDPKSGKESAVNIKVVLKSH